MPPWLGKKIETGRNTKNHQPRSRVVAWVLHYCSPVRQASLPARELEPIIRIARAGAVMRRTGKKLALAPEVCISLIAVEQTTKSRVKKAAANEAFIPIRKSGESRPSAPRSDKYFSPQDNSAQFRL
jgi:hypothetical protein